VCADDLLAAILSSTEDGLLSFTLDGILQSWSCGAQLLYGYSDEEIVGQPLARLLPSNETPRFDGLVHAAIQGDFPQHENAERLRKDGSSIYLGVSRTPIRNEQGDIVAIPESAKNRSFAVSLLDLDALKSINDRLGHLAGNRALKRLSKVMTEQCRATDLAARYGSDEFAVLLIDADPGMARQIASRIQIALRRGQQQPPLSVSVGFSIYPDDGRSAKDLLEAADRELYQRK
jgi:diguanylate cyclase (GGDEF)-like protein/PAS domain S-box-containing protein